MGLVDLKSGTGLATAVAIARGGATARSVAQVGAESEYLRTDASHAEDVEQPVVQAVRVYGRLDVAVNNAGIEGHQAPLVEQSEHDWDRSST